LFLDEIGDMSVKTQAKVLRALQEQVIEPVGGQSSVKVDVRVIAATNKNLHEEIREGRFRRRLVGRCPGRLGSDCRRRTIRHPGNPAGDR